MKKLLISACALSLAACAQSPSIDRSPDAPLSYDGLSPVINSRFEQAWADPEVDLAAFSKFMAAPAEFEFRRPNRPRDASPGRGTGAREFGISDEGKARLIEEVTAIFASELQSTRGWELVEEPGDDTLLLVGRFVDIVSHVPNNVSAGADVMITSVGEVRLVIEAKDSVSGETLFRAVQPSTISRRGGSIFVSPNNIASWAEVRIWARDWATALREGLESIHP